MFYKYRGKNMVLELNKADLLLILDCLHARQRNNFLGGKTSSDDK